MAKAKLNKVPANTYSVLFGKLSSFSLYQSTVLSGCHNFCPKAKIPPTPLTFQSLIPRISYGAINISLLRSFPHSPSRYSRRAFASIIGHPSSSTIHHSPLSIKKEYKQTYKPDSVESCHLSRHYVTAMLMLPTLSHRSGKPQTRVYLALHRIEFSLFTTAELYLVSVPLVLIFRRTDVIRYATLWCPDFPPCK